MKTKEEVIKEAYGEVWDKLTERDKINMLNDNGCHDEYQIFNDHNIDFENLSIFEPTYESPRYRPSDLEGIENNNGWISINSVEDLPIEDGEYYVINRFHGGMSTLQSYGNIQETKHVCKSWIHNYSHYQPIGKPLKPLY